MGAKWFRLRVLIHHPLVFNWQHFEVQENVNHPGVCSHVICKFWDAQGPMCNENNEMIFEKTHLQVPKYWRVSKLAGILHVASNSWRARKTFSRTTSWNNGILAVQNPGSSKAAKFQVASLHCPRHPIILSENDWGVKFSSSAYILCIYIYRFHYHILSFGDWKPFAGKFWPCFTKASSSSLVWIHLKL